MINRIHKIWIVIYRSVQRNTRLRLLILGGLILFLALWPRVSRLDTFLTADEDDQYKFSALFLQAVLRQDWAGALVLGYPGVPTMSFGATGLWMSYQAYLNDWGTKLDDVFSPQTALANSDMALLLGNNSDAQSNMVTTKVDLATFLAQLQNDPLRYIVPLRLPMAIVASLIILVIFALLTRLINPNLAFATTLLIAFDPFFLANSRVIHVDAPLTYFMFASFLAFIIYMKRGGWPWLIVSGIFGGLGMLSKTPGAILGPILVASGICFIVFAPPGTKRWQQSKRFIIAMAAWGSLAAIAFFALWPSMWARPMFALEWIINTAKHAFTMYHPSSGVFWGPVSDHSPWYYMIALPFHLTPFTSIGLIAGVGIVIWGIRLYFHQPDNFLAQNIPFILALLAYILIFFILVSFVPRRGVRYLLPIFPACVTLATLVIWIIFKQLRPGWRHFGFGAAVVTQLASVVTFHPYYFSYVNPLLGGAEVAPQYVILGWGEGLNQAANYLNQKPQAEKLKVTSWYSGQFAPYFRGQTIDLSRNEPAYTADYTVFYLNQVQRNLPSSDLVHYFQDREAEATLSINGLDYAWIYPGPIVGETIPETRYPLNVNFGDKLFLAGFDSDPKTVPADIGSIPLTLYWKTLASLPVDYNVSIRVVDDQGIIWGQVDRFPIGGLIRTSVWQPGWVVRDDYRLKLDPAMPPGTYTFDILVYDFDRGDIFGQVRRVGAVNITPALKPVAQSTLADIIPNKTALNLDEDLQLIGHNLAFKALSPGKTQDVKFYWYAPNKPKQNYHLSLMAEHETGPVFEVLNQPIGPAVYPTSQWPRGQILAQNYRYALPVDAPAGAYTLLAQTITGDAPIELGQFNLNPLPRLQALPNSEQITPITAYFGDDITLVGYQLQENAGEIDLSLYWQTKRPLKENYNIFVHLSQADETIVAQHDSVPGNGDRPTSGWMSDEFIVDSYHLSAPPGEYTLWLGLYNPLDFKRLSPSGPITSSADRLELAKINIRP